MAATASQFSCFSAIYRSRRHRSFSVSRPSLRFSKIAIVRSLQGSNSNTTDFVIKKTCHATGASESQVEETSKLHPSVEEFDAGHLETTELQEPAEVGTVPKRAAKIHDFCFGIPFGGIVLSGGLISLILSRSPAALTSLISGVALLAFSTLSLKIWRQGKSSFPFILGQAVFTAAFFWNNVQTYSLTKNLFPAAFYAVLSAAMLCFYLYVVMAGGNPPPKKLKPSPSAA